LSFEGFIPVLILGFTNFKDETFKSRLPTSKSLILSSSPRSKSSISIGSLLALFAGDAPSVSSL